MCPLCSASAAFYHQDNKREYWQCSVCQLVFVPAQFHLSAQAEKAEYDLHENHFSDQGYQRFLLRALNPVMQRLTPPASGFDFGCGPNPVLAKLASEQGYKMAVYDLYYHHAPEQQANLQRQFDFVMSTEVIEHVWQAAQTWAQLWQCVNANGLLTIMTKRVSELAAFKTWHYKNDATHICFYSIATFEYLAELLNAELSIVDRDVVIFKKHQHD